MAGIGEISGLGGLASTLKTFGSMLMQSSNGPKEEGDPQPHLQGISDSSSISEDAMAELQELIEIISGSGDSDSSSKADEMGIDDLYGGPREGHTEDPGYEQVYGSSSSDSDSSSKADEMGIDDLYGGPREGHTEDPGYDKVYGSGSSTSSSSSVPAPGTAPAPGTPGGPSAGGSSVPAPGTAPAPNTPGGPKV